MTYTDTIVTPLNTNLDEQDIIKTDGNYYLVVSKLPKTPTVSTFQFERYNVRRLAALP